MGGTDRETAIDLPVGYTKSAKIVAVTQAAHDRHQQLRIAGETVRLPKGRAVA
jgi:protein involved in sex pheromone biosynthesis